MFTLPTTRKGTAMVQPRLGVKINSISYWSEAFLDPDVEKTQVSVRYDPFDAGIAYAFVKGRWVRCISEHYARLAGRSEREVKLATAELRKRNQRHAQQFTITARKLADFLASLEAEEALLEQRLQDAEAQDVLASIGGSRVYSKEDGLSEFESLSIDDGSEVERPEHQFKKGKPYCEDALVVYEDY